MGRVFQDNLFCETVFGGLQVARNALQKTQVLMGEMRPRLLKKCPDAGRVAPISGSVFYQIYRLKSKNALPFAPYPTSSRNSMAKVVPLPTWLSYT